MDLSWVYERDGKLHPGKYWAAKLKNMGPKPARVSTVVIFTGPANVQSASFVR